MKEIWNFLQWQWQRFEGWQKMFMFAMFLQGAGWGMGRDIGLYVSGLGMGIIVSYILKWCVWDGIRSSWAKYKSHRNELLTTIRDSHK
jgi:hypothetical protein